MLCGDQVVTRKDHDVKPETFLKGTDGVTLVVQNVESDIAMHADAKLVHCPFHRLFLDHAQHLQGRGLDGPDAAGAFAMRAEGGDRFIEADAKSLTRHLEKAEMTDRTDLDARAVVAHGVLHPAFDGLLVPVLLHVDEIDNDKPGQVAKSKLAGQFVGGFQIGLQRGFLDIPLARGAPGIDVDGDERLGLVDHQIATRLQGHLRAMDGVHLLLDLVALEDRQRVVIFLHTLHMAGNQHFHLRAGFLVGLFALDENLIDLACVEIADRSLDQIAFLMDQAWCLRFQRLCADLVPELRQIGVVARNFRLGALGPGGANNHGGAVLNVEPADNGFQPFAVGGVGDLAADPAAAGRVWHKNAIAAGKRKVGRQRGALVAALFLDDLHKHDLLSRNHFLNLVFADLALRPDVLFVGVLAANGFRGVDAVLIAILGIVAGALGSHQGLAVLDRDTVIVRVDFTEGEKTLAVAAIFNKGRLKGRLDAGHACEIDIAFELLPVFRFVVEILNARSA